MAWRHHEQMWSTDSIARTSAVYATSILRHRPIPERKGLFGILVVAHWHGERGLLAATILPCAPLLVLCKLVDAVFESIDWVWHYQAAGAATVLLVVLLILVAVWGGIGVARSARQAHDYGESRLRAYGSAGIVMACALATAGQFGSSTWEELSWAATLARDSGKRVEIQTDTELAKMVIRGKFHIGTTRRVRDAFVAAPWVRLVELDSPGGLAIEGLALSGLLEARGVDTLVVKGCFSACISAYAAGERRYLGAKATLGLHSAGGPSRKRARELDALHGRILVRRGVAKWLIEAEWETPIDDLLLPGPNTLLASGLVTRMWPVRP